MFIIDALDPADRDHMVLEAAGQIQFGQLNLVAEDVIDAADMAAVRTKDFKMFSDEGGVHHEYLLVLLIP